MLIQLAAGIKMRARYVNAELSGEKGAGCRAERADLALVTHLLAGECQERITSLKHDREKFFQNELRQIKLLQPQN